MVIFRGNVPLLMSLFTLARIEEIPITVLLSLFKFIRVGLEVFIAVAVENFAFLAFLVLELSKLDRVHSILGNVDVVGR